MIQNIKEDMLMKTIGQSINNSGDEPLGEVVEIKNKKGDTSPEYIILKTSICYGDQDRFFAIPVSSELIKQSGDSIYLQVDKNDLQVAKEIEADKLPVTNERFDLPIYEVYQYVVPVNRN